MIWDSLAALRDSMAERRSRMVSIVGLVSMAAHLQVQI
jgi:hypothetical protein